MKKYIFALSLCLTSSALACIVQPIHFKLGNSEKLKPYTVSDDFRNMVFSLNPEGVDFGNVSISFDESTQKWTASGLKSHSTDNESKNVPNEQGANYFTPNVRIFHIGQKLIIEQVKTEKFVRIQFEPIPKTDPDMRQGMRATIYGVGDTKSPRELKVFSHNPAFLSRGLQQPGEPANASNTHDVDGPKAIEQTGCHESEKTSARPTAKSSQRVDTKTAPAPITSSLEDVPFGEVYSID